MRILIISYEVWRDNTNGGNVLTNIFSKMDAEFAQIYCTPGTPQNDLCKKYYQITDNMIIKNIFRGYRVGYQFSSDDYLESCTDMDTNPNMANGRWYNKIKKYRLSSFYALEEIMWKFAKVYDQSLKNFIDDFSPDIIFAPCYGKHMMLRLTRFIAKYTGKPIVSYISDDNYSLRQAHISPVYWANRLILRYNLRKTFPYYSLVYTMTDEQKLECEIAFGANMKILRKSMDCKNDIRNEINTPIKLIFAGGIYCGRWKTLMQIARAVKLINEGSGCLRMELHIYTQNSVTKTQNRILNDKINSYIHPSVSQEEMWRKYADSDIALHVESFDIVNRLKTRLSFSTKIVDCLASGCAVMAVAWKEHSGLTYLKKEDAAICIDNLKSIYSVLSNICNDHSLLYKYKLKAHDCLSRNHNEKITHDMIYNDFKRLIDESSAD